jgi:hypothetical protein
MNSLTRRLTVLFLPLVAVMAACGDPDRATGADPGRARRDVSDGSNGGPNPHFFWLAPIGGTPTTTGEFSAAWQPTITICLLVNGSCAAAPVTIAGPSSIAVSTINETYQYNWNTDGTAFNATAINTYRLAVTLPTSPATVIGYADILINNPGQSEGSGPGGVIAFNDGRTVPIKFRIEKGVLGGTGDFEEFLVPNSGKVIKVPFAGVYFTPGWLGNDPPVFDPQVTVIFQRIAIGTETCRNASNLDLAALLTNMETYAGCFRLLTIPAVADITPDGKLGADVIMAMCTEVAETGDRYDAQSMFKYDAPSALLELENVAPYAPTTVPGGTGGLFLTSAECEGFTSSSQQQFGMLWNGARALARGFGKVFGPNTAYALDAGLGGRIPAGSDGFSDFFFGVPPRIQKVAASDAQTATVGTALLIDPTALVTARHDHGASHPLGNIPVTFELLAGNGSLGLVDLTNLDEVVSTIAQGQAGHGTASVPWVMPADPGTYTLKASISASPGDQSNAQTIVYFTATATATVPRSGKEVRIVGPESPGYASNVYMAPNVGRPFNAKAYIDGKSTNSVCIWSTAASNSYVTIVPSGANDPGSVSISIAPATAGGNRGKVNITCGSGSTGVSRSIFFFATQ